MNYSGYILRCSFETYEKQQQTMIYSTIEILKEHNPTANDCDIVRITFSEDDEVFPFLFLKDSDYGLGYN